MSAVVNRSEVPLIAVVDDDEAVRSALSLLGRARGWEVQAFASAEAYLSAATAGDCPRPACLVLDLHMPDMDGAALQEKLHRRGEAVPTVIISAQPDSDLARRALAAGARSIIGKPFAPSEWIRVVEAALEAPR